MLLRPAHLREARFGRLGRGELGAQLEARGAWIPRRYPTTLARIIRDVPVHDLCFLGDTLLEQVESVGYWVEA